MKKFLIVIMFFFITAVPFLTATDHDNTPVALVLSGGGARGAYQIGVWKALRDMGIEIGAVYGVSVGAINGIFIVMDEFDIARNLWMSLEKSQVMKIDEASKRVISGEFSIGDLYSAVLNIYQSGGIDVSPLGDLLSHYVDEQEVRSGGKDFGLITYSLTSFTEKALGLDEIPEGQLVDYILASANFPVFQRKIISGQEFIDGGVSRNIAVDMVDGSRFSNAVVVSLNTNMPQDFFDYLTEYSRYDFETTYINPRFDTGSLLDFDSENSCRLIKMGYLDCLKTYEELIGKSYYLYGEDPVFYAYTVLNEHERYTAAEILEIENLPDIDDFRSALSYYGIIMPEILKTADSAVDLIEDLAVKQGINPLELYSTSQLFIKTVDKYICKSHNRWDYDRFLDFLSYVKLESEYRLTQGWMLQENTLPGIYLESYAGFSR